MAKPADRLLIVNADDYGLTPAVSEGILRGFRDGIITSTSVLVLGRGFTRSIGWLAETPGIGTGVHLALVGEDPPLLSAREIPTLVDRRGRLARSWRSLLPRVAARRIDLADVERELAAQVVAVEGAGVTVDHLDSHQHVHMFPGLRRVVVDVAHRFDVPAIRVTRAASRGPSGLLLRRLAATLVDELDADGIAYPLCSTGLDEAGGLDETRLLQVIARFAAESCRSVEISGHPGEAVDTERDRYRWGYRWADELAAVLSPRVADAIARHGFVRATYRDLVRVKR
jgi:chitin disaccharide deacetylase